MELSEVETEFLSMLERQGQDPEHLDPWDAWKVFKSFLQRPIDCEDDSASFQARQAMGIDGNRRYYVSFIRQLAVLEDGRTIPIRHVVVEIGFNIARFVNTVPLTLWSDDFPTIEGFIYAVEGIDEFLNAMGAPIEESDVFVEEC